MAGGVIPVGICRWDLKDGVEGREETMLAGVSARVLISEGSDSVAGKNSKYKKEKQHLNWLINMLLKAPLRYQYKCHVCGKSTVRLFMRGVLLLPKVISIHFSHTCRSTCIPQCNYGQ